jgi:hypothetical protein
MDCSDSLPVGAADDGNGWDDVGNSKGRGNCLGTRAFFVASYGFEIQPLMKMMQY